MEKKFSVRVDGLEPKELMGVIVVQPTQKPSIKLMEGTDLRYNPAQKTWRIIVNNRKLLQEEWGMTEEDFKSKILSTPILLGNQSVDQIPCGFTIVKVKAENEARLIPQVDWNMGIGPYKPVRFPTDETTIVWFEEDGEMAVLLEKDVDPLIKE